MPKLIKPAAKQLKSPAQKPHAEVKPAGHAGKTPTAKAAPVTDVAPSTPTIPTTKPQAPARPTPAWKNRCRYCGRPMPDNRDVLICGRCANTVARTNTGTARGKTPSTATAEEE